MSDETSDGIVHNEKNFFAVSFTPEIAVGATNMNTFIDLFIDTVRATKAGKTDKSIKSRIHNQMAFELKTHIMFRTMKKNPAYYAQDTMFSQGKPKKSGELSVSCAVSMSCPGE